MVRLLSYLSGFYFGSTIQSEVAMSMVIEKGLQDIQHSSHLGEDERPVITSL